MSGDYIKLSRSILEWEWWSDINTCRVFTYILLKANWKDASYKGTTVPRGSFVSSLSKLSEETKLTENEVRTAIKHLKSTGEITSKAHNKFTVFTVKNYDAYQSDNKQDDKETTNKSQPINNNRRKERKEEYKNIYRARGNRFNDFPQEDYNADDLENKLLSN